MFHAVVRGNNRRALFLEDRDYSEFADLVDHGVRRFGHRVHAFCFMTNHVHLLAEVDAKPLSQIAHNLCSRYARSFNRRRSRSGHLFERRYWARLVRSDAGLLQVLRYIHLNPVQADLAADPAEYKWSSHASYLGKRKTRWLTTRRMLKFWGTDFASGGRGLDRFVKAGLGSTMSRSGGEDFTSADADVYGDVDPEGLEPVLEIFGASMNSDLARVLGVVCDVTGVSIDDLRSRSQRRVLAHARSLAAVIVQSSSHLRLSDLGSALHRDVSTVSRSATSAARRAQRDKRLTEQIQQVSRLL